MEKPTPEILQDPTIPFRLRSFATSKRYAPDAKLLAATVMSRMSDADGFSQLFNFIFPNGEDADINTMLEIARQQNFSFKKTDAECINKSTPFDFGNNAYHDVCWNGYSDKQIEEFKVNPNDTNGG